jgi:predicted DNA-binding protein (MmcQ/YjbR family)
MISTKTFRKLALSFDYTTEEAHFDKQSFLVKNKIFATLDEQTNKVVVKLSEVDQSAFCSFDRTIIYPVHGAWGKKGWTVIELTKVKKEIVVDALKVAYQHVAPKKLSEKQIL